MLSVPKESFANKAKKCIKQFNRSLRFASEFMIKLKYGKFYLNSIRVIIFCDVAVANNEEHSSRLGCVILLVDCDNEATIISCRSFKSRRVTRSALVEEVIAFADFFGQTFTQKKTVELALNHRVYFHFLTDSKSLFDFISKRSRTNEKFLMLDIHAVREEY